MKTILKMIFEVTLISLMITLLLTFSSFYYAKYTGEPLLNTSSENENITEYTGLGVITTSYIIDDTIVETTPALDKTGMKNLFVGILLLIYVIYIAKNKWKIYSEIINNNRCKSNEKLNTEN
jgi:hypothetical protein